MSTKVAPKPSTDFTDFPWAFKIGERVYAGELNDSYLIIDGFVHRGFPHYKVLDKNEQCIQLLRLCW